MSRSRLRAPDLIGVGTLGLRSRPGRTVLTALGIAIGIAAMVAILGISASSRADLLAQLDELGTNLLTVSPGQSVFGDAATLPESAPAMLRRIGPVQEAAATTAIDAGVYRSDQVPETDTNGLGAVAAEHGLLDTISGVVATGDWLTAGNGVLPEVVLGATAAQRLGIASLDGHPRIWIGGLWVAVVGILEPLPLAPELDGAALVSVPFGVERLGASTSASTVYLRADPQRLDAVAAVAPPTANPDAPEEVEIRRPADALAARSAVDTTLTALLLGLGGVALLVGAVGIANVMVIAVLERRREIGVRRALGATRAHIRRQFVVESALLALLGGVAGLVIGSAVTAGYAADRGWTVAVPMTALGGGVGAALLVGALAGLYPAARAARLDPAEAVRG